jgi:bacterioferritin-associated ferredoxin
MASTKRSMLPMDAECKATEPAPRAGSCRTRSAAWRPPAFLLIERRVAAPVISVHCHSWLQRVRHEKHRRSPTPGLAKEPARVQYSGCGYGRKPGSIQHGRFCPHPAGPRSRPVPQELGATTSLGLFENLDAGITRESHHHVVVDVLAIRRTNLEPQRSVFMIVCSCNILSDHDVRSAVRASEDLPCNAKQVYGCLGCSAECGRCARTIKTIIDQALDLCASTSVR